jgi:hypothetical protein
MKTSAPNTAQHESKDARSVWLAYACLALAFALPLASLYFLFHDWPNALLAAFAGTASPSQLASLQSLGTVRSIVVVALALVPVALMALSLWHAHLCFIRFSFREYFSREAVLRMWKFALAMFLAAIACTVVPPLISVALTVGGPQKASLVVSMGTQHLILFLFAGVVWQLASVLAKAAALAEENAQFV